MPSASPGNIKVSTSSSSPSLTIDWDEVPCGDRKGNITGYIYRLTHATNTVIPDTKVTELSVTISTENLSPDTPYSFSVAAQNSAGTGPFRNRVIYVESKLDQ